MPDEDEPPAWFLEAQRKQEAGLVVGARVRVQLSECEWTRWAASHQPSINGATATVGSHRRDDYHGHTIVVTLDSALDGCWAFAAAELTPLAPDGQGE